ncbi:glycosyltransferase, group 1 family protein [Leptospira broomii serovar Hurstbridge str. 5399]|uniref:Glycosyltransferase, group 1 family protein n=1 Tax=Leptospira broomii serovar Hurstbridge str. 5399 TaxID=1049789 RepID=T0FCU1_9LEPT|nr:glycosyltransferase family 4 protein [Leptospira broomii]EQA45681.1 glycosyltransferase, group 1 family protein [Leptospira broomii serovar Hurstbridge str. 5399]
MGRQGIHQFAAGFNLGDAISNEMSSLRSVFRRLGYSSEIFAENTGPGTATYVRKYKYFKPKGRDILFYHHSIHSNVLDFIRKTKQPKILVYHNVTPPSYFEKYDLKLTYLLRKGREELKQIKDEFSLSFAVSEFNKKELEELGYENVKLLPITYQIPSKPIFFGPRIAELQARGPRFLFVGRISPNKRQDDLIRFAYYYLNAFGEDFQLFLVGFSSKELYLYREELERMLDFYKLRRNVIITDFLTDEGLQKMYRECDLFISMSEHEGFCVPLLEAMVHGIPVMAFDAGAVSETLSGAGILFKEKKMDFLAELANKIITDPKLNRAVLDTQEKRIRNFSTVRPESILRPILAEFS